MAVVRDGVAGCVGRQGLGLRAAVQPPGAAGVHGGAGGADSQGEERGRAEQGLQGGPAAQTVQVVTLRVAWYRGTAVGHVVEDIFVRRL